MNRLWLPLLILFVAALHQPAAAAESRPNIVLILADDLGWTDLACMGSEYYETPHIDRLAQQGVTLQSFYVCQNCAPTRAALISGQYAPRTGIYTVGTFKRGREQDRGMIPPENQRQLPTDKVTIAEALKQAGYVTGMFGKWHLGNGKEYHPSQRGFDEAIVSNGRHFKFRTIPPTRKPADDEYLADFLTDRAVDFIDRHSDEPFFLYLPHFAVHVPLHAKPDLISRYRAKAGVGGHNDPVYAAMIHSVDESVGRVTDALERHGLSDNTLLIFTSDNGGVGGYRVPGTDQRKGTTDNTPLRGGKGMLYEGGVRVPFIARWPGAIPSGSKSDAPVAHVDLYPTFVELAGGTLPEDYTLDGTSAVDVLKQPSAAHERPPIYWHFPGYLESYIEEDVWRTTPVSVIRDGNFKLLEFFEDDRLELYDLSKDIEEKHDLSTELPEKTRALHEKLEAWRDETGALMARQTP
ncbi:Arylsulfatase [Maioricimonas rarisocia]|uniref:Arylsulfatase n=1 Tax=Maioricimonas rarisocia TaxID=2528026 RepID=A0A517ZG15_9PLAN|nr:sulfatase [Maioricimonas rarisocia]QDU41404.1 Arylsulfatase [Maioricimonas rarisocia]